MCMSLLKSLLMIVPLTKSFSQAGCKFLVFAHHQPMIDAIDQFFQVGHFISPLVYESSLRLLEICLFLI